ncbi:gliding motility-associated C-terminal domain-containing protein, partial [uncultured Cytophaga sp.]|uniref:T9SS type B sorting domain-containing protein n=1 Tax=uncultured Cytophaga sp. TaxID=160238 RepID=UPI00260A8D85
VSETGQYNMVVKNSCGTRADSLYVNNSTLNVTNLVTANNDNKNDCLYAISNNANETIRMSIYNSWGSNIFSDNNYKNNWCPNNDVSDGVYYYEATYNNNCSKKGWVEIVH